MVRVSVQLFLFGPINYYAGQMAQNRPPQATDSEGPFVEERSNRSGFPVIAFALRATLDLLALRIESCFRSCSAKALRVGGCIPILDFCTVMPHNAVKLLLIARGSKR